MTKPNFKLTPAVTKGNYTEIHIEPLEKGFGHTLGNSLRRVLLTNLEGAAATQVKIEGVKHQFSTLSGLHENIIDFLLNLKGIHFQMDGEGPATVKLEAKGKTDVTAADLVCPAGIKVTNPDHHLAKLTDAKARLKATIKVEKGTGFVLAEEHATDEIGVIPLDSVFTPVIRANYLVDATRVGRRADLDKIRLMIETNGTTTPVEAVQKAAQILIDYFDQIIHPVFEESQASFPASSLLVDQAVEELDLPTRITNALKKGGYKKLKDFHGAKMADLLKVKNLGEKSVQEVIKRLAKKAIEIKD